MRTFETYGVMYVDLDHPEMMVNWGGGTRRKRAMPRSLTVAYHRDHGGRWRLKSVYLGLDRVHKNASFGFGIFVFDSGEWKHPVPDWLYHLVDSATPALVAA